MTNTELQVRVIPAIGDVAADAWNACANRSPSKAAPADRLQGRSRRRNRLIHRLKKRYSTHLYHTSFSMRSKPQDRPRRAPAGSRSTSLPRPPTAPYSGVAPCYLKSHSRGEYVFDQGWADAYERAGGEYYPKLQVAVPFTPADGTAPAGAARSRRGGDPRRRLPPAMVELCRMRQASSVHVTFATEAEWRLLGIARIPAAHRPAVPLGESRLRLLRRFPRRARRAQAQGDQARAARGAGRRDQRPLADRHRPHRERLGCVLRVLHGHRLAQMGPALPHARVLLARRRKHARSHPAGDGQARRALDRRRHQLHRLRHALRPPLGRGRGPPVPALRALLLPGDRVRDRSGACGSRRARKASTSSRAATCR